MADQQTTFKEQAEAYGLQLVDVPPAEVEPEPVRIDAAGLLPDNVQAWLAAHPSLAQLVGVGVLLAVAVLVLAISRRLLRPLVGKAIGRTKFRWDDALVQTRIVDWLSWLPGALILHYGIYAVPQLAEPVRLIVQNVASATMVVIAMMVISGLLNAVNLVYTRFERSKSRPIKGYLTIAKLFVYLAGAIIAIAALVDKSPWIFLSGLGAMTAVLLLIFKDTILGLVASVQLTSNDMVRIGDWIQMDRMGANGDVIDITLHTVKVQNWDKTITTIPTYQLISDSFINWRGMTQVGGRRIKRAFSIDLSSIRFLDDDDIERFSRFVLLRDYMAEKKRALEAYNREHAADRSVIANARRLTNVGTLRAYIVAYLRGLPHLRQDLTFLVRQLAPTPQGLPIEIYVFTATTAWAEYEGIQADIFDHILAIVPEFGLRVFQSPSGIDVQHAGEAGAAAGAAGAGEPDPQP